MPHSRGQIVADGGIQLSSGAAAGKVAVCDASGNISWQVFPTFRSWTVYGAIAIPVGDTNYIPPIFITEPSWASLNITKVRYVIHSGTSVTFKMQQNGVDIAGFTGLSATTTATSTTGSVAVVDDDMIQPIVTAVAGTPYNLTIELVIQ